jgi:NAD(P)-dependent dehydrogenase (short-subunit alcohol dehydrogenase family)
MPLFSLEGRVALVTGASRGIGAGCAEVLAEMGATVAVNYHRGQVEAEQVVAHLQALGRDAVPMQTDVSDPDDARRLVHRVIDRFGKLDIVVNNAGFNASPPVIMQMSPEETVKRWHWTLDTNLASQFHISHEAIAGMTERGWGRIINISSISGVRGGLIGDVEYAASKAGILGLTRGLARFVAKKGITVNALAVGIIDTDALHKTVSAERLEREIIPAIPVGRLGTPRDVGYLVGFLASNEAEWITGETIQINGGHHIA